MTFIGYKKFVELLLHLILNLCLFLFKQTVCNLFKQRFQFNQRVKLYIRLLLYLYIILMNTFLQFLDISFKCGFLSF